METQYAKVLRDADLEKNFVGERLMPRQFGYASDTNALAIRDADGVYHFIRNYDDADIRKLIDAIESGDGGSLAAHIANMTVHITNTERQTWDAKQDALIAGNNIQIANDGKTISAAGGASVANLSGQPTAAFGQSAADGSASTAARSDHYHALPAAPSVPTGANLSQQAWAYGQSERDGSAATFARSDHYHRLPPVDHTLLSGECTTAAGTALKQVSINNYIQTNGSIVCVTFTNANTAANPRLKVNQMSDYDMQYNGTAVQSGQLGVGILHIFVLDTSVNGAWRLLNPVVSQGGGGSGASVANLSGQGTPAFGQLAANGSAATAARSDHVHALPDLSFNNLLPAYGYCSTGSSTAAKTVSIPGFVLRVGSLVGVDFSAAPDNEAAGAYPTLNVNSTGAKPVYYGGHIEAGRVLTGMILDGVTHIFMYDGTYWNLLNPAQHTNAINTAQLLKLCNTAAGTAGKVVQNNEFRIQNGSIVGVIFTYANTAANPTLNVNSTGAKPIFYNGAAIAPNMISNTHAHLFLYDNCSSVSGNYGVWHLLNPTNVRGEGGSYLPLAGGTMTGPIAFSDQNAAHVSTSFNVAGITSIDTNAYGGSALAVNNANPSLGVGAAIIGPQYGIQSQGRVGARVNGTSGVAVELGGGIVFDDNTGKKWRIWVDGLQGAGNQDASQLRFDEFYDGNWRTRMRLYMSASSIDAGNMSQAG
ncbi:MAG: hypothetical protein LBC59_09465 [Chitinispirillales bacterium]|jgi:hypothetical protein|nr:hypothetical protein [Chitinispirillales bacterium]